MGTPWSKLRREQHDGRHPPVERSEQKRLAQQRYRVTHADELRTARQVGQILTRRTTYADDCKKLVALIRSLTGDEFARALGRELTRRAGRRHESSKP
jgi:hypothetical protein